MIKIMIKIALAALRRAWHIFSWLYLFPLRFTVIPRIEGEYRAFEAEISTLKAEISTLKAANTVQVQTIKRLSDKLDAARKALK